MANRIVFFVGSVNIDLQGTDYSNVVIRDSLSNRDDWELLAIVEEGAVGEPDKFPLKIKRSLRLFAYFLAFMRDLTSRIHEHSQSA